MACYYHVVESSAAVLGFLTATLQLQGKKEGVCDDTVANMMMITGCLNTGCKDSNELRFKLDIR